MRVTGVRNYTFARIKTGDRENEQIVAQGKVARYQHDKFDKEQARKYALDAALDASTFSTNRDFRSAARTAYHTRPGGLDYKPQAVEATKFSAVTA